MVVINALQTQNKSEIQWNHTVINEMTNLLEQPKWQCTGNWLNSEHKVDLQSHRRQHRLNLSSLFCNIINHVKGVAHVHFIKVFPSVLFFSVCNCEVSACLCDFVRQECWISVGLTGWHWETAESLDRVCGPNTCTHTNRFTHTDMHSIIKKFSPFIVKTLKFFFVMMR